MPWILYTNQRTVIAFRVDASYLCLRLDLTFRIPKTILEGITIYETATPKLSYTKQLKTARFIEPSLIFEKTVVMKSVK